MAMTVEQIKTNIALAAKFAYGSGMTEKTKGGEGNIGFLNGRIFKFNTHSSERGGPVTDAMRASCSQLRAHLGDLAQKLLAEEHNNGSMTQAAFQNEMKRIRTMLGLNADDGSIVDKGLLSRKVVAKVVTRLGKATGTNFWDMRSDDAVNQQLKFGDDEEIHTTNDLSSKGKATHFTGVAEPMIKQMAKDYLTEHANEIEEMTQTICKEINSVCNATKDSDVVSTGNKSMIANVLRHSVEAVIAEKGSVSTELLTGPGSTYAAIRNLVTGNHLKGSDQQTVLMKTLSHANSLPPAEANAFLRAFALVPSAVCGTVYRLHAVAKQLAQLPPGKFTPANVLKLAAPDLPIPESIKNKTEALTEKEINDFYQLYSDLRKRVEAKQYAEFEKLQKACLDAKKTAPNTDNSFYTQFDYMLECGVSLKDLKTCFLKNRRHFSGSMLPQNALMVEIGNINDTPQKVCTITSLGDLHRNKPIITIQRENKTEYKMPDGLFDKYRQHTKMPDSEKTYAQDYFKKIEDLCGTENEEQQMMVFLHLSQCGFIGEGLMNAFMDNTSDPARYMRISLRKDEKTGDILIHRETDHNLTYHMSIDLRVRTDGSQVIDDLQTFAVNPRRKLK